LAQKIWPNPSGFKVFGSAIIVFSFQKLPCPHIFLRIFDAGLTMFGGEVSNLPKASASEAEDKCGDYAVYMKA
jgi:hypothetical protein